MRRPFFSNHTAFKSIRRCDERVSRNPGSEVRFTPFIRVPQPGGRYSRDPRRLISRTVEILNGLELPRDETNRPTVLRVALAMLAFFCRTFSRSSRLDEIFDEAFLARLIFQRTKYRVICRLAISYFAWSLSAFSRQAVRRDVRSARDAYRRILPRSRTSCNRNCIIEITAADGNSRSGRTADSLRT